MMKHCQWHTCLVSWGLLLAGLLAVNTAAAKVVISFTGTVTEVGGINASPPSGVGAGSAVSGTVSYNPAAATMVEVGPGERAYIFMPGTGNEISIAIGTYVWKADLQTVGVCDELCDGDFLDFSAVSSTTLTFPSNLGSGLLMLSFSDSVSPFALVNGNDLPNAAEDVNFGATDAKAGSVTSSGVAGYWSILFDVSSPTVPATTSTWSEVKALYARP